MSSSISEVRVRYAETDQMGVAYHANYLVWCEIGRTDLIRQCGMPYSEMESRGVMLAVSEASLRFHASARYDDVVRIETSITDVKSRSVSFAYHISRVADGARLASATTSLVSLSKEGKPVAMPADIRALMDAARG
jgi:acyl-CoA thioester hydrolase